MPAKKRSSRKIIGSNLAQVDAHVIQPHEYDEIPELTEEFLSRSVFKIGGRPVSKNPRVSISLRLPMDVLARWRATGPGWQTRMVERLRRVK
jgi:uncharacterized protein (DUF4415 family)